MTAYNNTTDTAGIDIPAENITTGELTSLNKTFRLITLALQIIAMLAYYLPALISGGSAGLIWLVIGVVQTAMFSVIYFRNAHTRTGISITLMVLATILNLGMLITIGSFALIVSMLGLSLTAAFLYALCSLVAVIFALCFPRRYK